MQNRLKQVRQEKGITIAELARNAKVTRQTIYNIEGDPNANVSSRVMSRIALAIGVKASDIFLI